jgi:hypothetical protein
MFHKCYGIKSVDFLRLSFLSVNNGNE